MRAVRLRLPLPCAGTSYRAACKTVHHARAGRGHRTRSRCIHIEAACDTFHHLHALAGCLGAFGLGRVYCIIIDATGRDLNELLVENGLARIYGTRTVLFDGRDSRAYLARLGEVEEQAKRERKGAWRFAPG